MTDSNAPRRVAASSRFGTKIGRVAVAALLLSFLPFLALAQEEEWEEGDAPNGGFTEPAPANPTPNESPAAVLRAAVAELAALAETPMPRRISGQVRRAGKQAERALKRYTAPDSNLKRTLAGMRNSARALDKARSWNTDPAVGDDFSAHAAVLVDTARGIVEPLVALANARGVDSRKVDRALLELAAGDDIRDQGNNGGAIGKYGMGLKLKNAIVFDVDLFRTNIQNALAGQTVGYAVAVARNGKLVQSATWGTGSFRTASDAPIVAASPTLEMNIASITKPITAAGVMFLLQRNILGESIGIDDPIGPYIPHDWARGAGVEDITIRELLTHRSGLANNLTRGRTSFADLQTFVATDITMARDSDGLYPYLYQNGNFALFRILIPYMTAYTSSIGQHCNFPDLCNIGTAQSTAESFRLFMQCDVLNTIGLAADYVPFGDDPYGCAGPDFIQRSELGPITRLYGAGLGPMNGVDPGDWTLVGGGGGWYMSATELAQFLAHLRYGKDFLSKKSRDLMYENYLGFMDSDPLFGNYAFGSGIFGSYRMHGGDLCYPTLPVPAGQSACAAAFQPQGVDTCIADFPDGTQVALLINSMGGTYPYQCTVLKNAFEAANVKK